jgi:hypothetical protein
MKSSIAEGTPSTYSGKARIEYSGDYLAAVSKMIREKLRFE